ncbi:MAG: hypothetical protein U0736_22760 [Gemmataceae bacterium]
MACCSPTCITPRRASLQVDVLAADAARQGAAVRTLVERAELPEAVVAPAGVSRAAQVVVREHGWAAKGDKWADLLAALQAALAGSTAPADALFSRTRLDRATFTLDAAERPVLTFAGVTLFDPAAVPAADRTLVDRYRAATEAERAKLLASDEYRKPPHARLRAKLLAEARKRLPRPDYDSSVDPVGLVASPAPQAQRALPDELRRQGGVVLGFRYGPAGELVADTRFLPAAARPKVEAAFRDLLRTSPALRAGSAVRVEGGDERADWAGWLRAWQKRRAASNDILAKQTRLDGAAFDYDAALRLVLSVDGITLAADADRPKLADRLTEITAEELKGLRDYRVDVAHLRAEPSALRDLQAAAVADARLDGVLFAGAAYDADGVLHLDGFRGEDASRPLLRTLVADFVRKTPLVRPTDSVDEAIKPLAPLAWRSALDRVQETLAASADSLRRRTRVDRGTFLHGKDSVELRFRAVSLDPSRKTDDLRTALDAELRRQLPALKGVAFTTAFDGSPFVESPLVALQRLVAREKLDGVLFRDARYDGKGRLLLDVVPGEAGQKAAVDALLTKQPPAESLLPSAKVEPRWQVSYAAPLDWVRYLRDARERFARGGDDPLARRTRLDRAISSPPPTRRSRPCGWEGVSLQPADAPPEAPLKEIARRLTDTAPRWPGCKP